MANELYDTYMADLRIMVNRAPRSLATSGVQAARNFKDAVAKGHKVLGANKASLESLTAARNTLATFFQSDELRRRP